jgi:hypothetical protein
MPQVEPSRQNRSTRRHLLARGATVAAAAAAAVLGTAQTPALARSPIIWGRIHGINIAYVKGDGFTPGGRVRLIGYLPGTWTTWYDWTTVTAAGPNGDRVCLFFDGSQQCFDLAPGEIRAAVRVPVPVEGCDAFVRVLAKDDAAGLAATADILYECL